MSSYAANNLARATDALDETTGSGVEQALLAAGDIFSGLAAFTPVGIASNVARGFTAEPDEDRSFLDRLFMGAIEANEPINKFLTETPILNAYSFESNCDT